MKVPTPEKIQNMLIQNGALWTYTYAGDPLLHQPHALLTSGQHSNGFVNLGDLLKKSPSARNFLAQSLVALLRLHCPDLVFDYVVGADTSSTLLAQDIAENTDADFLRMIKSPDKSQTWDPSNPILRSGDRILHIEELITTAFSAQKVRDGIRLANPGTVYEYLPFLPVIIDRSDPDHRVTTVENSKIISLLQLNIQNWAPETHTCPYCAIGSVAIKPKEGDNWAKLTLQK